jgi:hypothetical protein
MARALNTSLTSTNNVRLALQGAAAVVRYRHGLEVEDEGHLKDFDVIFIFVDVFYTVCYLF